MSVLAHNRSASATRLAETRTGTARPLLCFVYSPTSGPSRRAEGFLAQVLQRRKNHRAFVVQRVNWVERPDLAKKLGTESVPSLVVVENRRVRARLEGVRGCRDIERLLEPWLGSSDEVAASGESLDDAEEAVPPTPARVPEPYPPPDELDLPSPDPDPDDGDEGDDD
jgi:thioredoxin-like negative regulator of GroEL